ncbi:MAG TPA: hypothetical protein DDY70_06105 [Clostridiales bacterium]|nr:hypothetical protein [Clostridiales bacterium]
MRTFLRKDRPTLTVMIRAQSRQRVLELIRKGLAGGADAFGIQLGLLPPEEWERAALTELIDATEGKPTYLTNYRRTGEDGSVDESLARGLLLAAECGGTLIDMMGDLFSPHPLQLTSEPRAVRRQAELIDALHERGAEVLISSHTYRFLPEAEVLDMVKEQHRRGADICKVVTGAENDLELSENFRTSARLAELSYPALFLCGGERCPAHRRVAPLLRKTGIFLCVAERDDLATPAQPLLQEAKRLVDTVFPIGEIKE